MSNEAEMVALYRPIAVAIAREYFIPGAEPDDVRQEALIGLLKGIRSYRPTVGTPIRFFLRMTIHQQIQDAVKAARRRRARVLTDALHDYIVDADDGLSLIESVAVPHDAHDAAVVREELLRLRRGFRTLSPLERRALLQAVNGVSYQGDKAVDNACQRARRKLRRAA